MFNVKPPHLADLEVENMKKFILDYKRYMQKCPRKLLQKMKQFISEEELEVICDKDGRDYENVVDIRKEEFIQVMLRLHQANSSRKWRILVKNAKMEKSDLSLNTHEQYVEPGVFWEEIYSRAFEILVDVMTRHELANYRYYRDVWKNQASVTQERRER